MSAAFGGNEIDAVLSNINASATPWVAVCIYNFIMWCYRVIHCVNILPESESYSHVTRELADCLLWHI